MLYYRFHLQYTYSDHSAMKREYDQSWTEGNKLEEICQKTRISYKTAQNEACRLMTDKTFMEELGRTYSAKNKREFLGHPVHYILHTSSRRETECLTQLLSAALYSNGRLVDKRITYIYEIREMPDKTEEIANLIAHAANTAVVVELRGSSQEHHGNYATEYAETIEYLCSLFLKHRPDTSSLLKGHDNYTYADLEKSLSQIGAGFFNE